ncbi:MAG: efflux RND transporter periplasmic adaptor subunit [Anaerolineae bacterium]
MRRVLWLSIRIVALSTLVLVGYFLLQLRSTNSEPTVSSVVEDSLVVSEGDLTVTVSGTGSLTPIRQVQLAFELSAPVKDLFVQEGQPVKAGEILATLDSADLQNAVMNAEISLASQRATYDGLSAPPRDVDIAVAEAALKAAQAQAGASSLGADPNQVEIARLQAELARNQLWQTQLQRDMQAATTAQLASQLGPLAGQATVPNPANTITPQIQQAENGVQLADVAVEGEINQPADVASLSSANAQIVAAQAQLDRLVNGPSEFELQISETQLQIAQLNLEQAQEALKRSYLVAPFDAIVAVNNLVIGELPPQGTALQLIDTSSYFVDVAVDETDIVNVEVGQPVQLRLDALPDNQITGQVTRAATTPVRAGQLVTYTVRVTLDPTNASLRALMTTTATIVVNELHHVVKIPNRFIRIDRSTQQAYVTIDAGNQQFMDVPVTLGARNEIESQIVSGLAAGTRIVLIPREAFNPIG